MRFLNISFLKNYVHRFTLLTTVFLVISGCSLDEIETQDFTLGSSYYPLSPYRHIDYRVLQIRYSLFQGNDTSQFFLREAVVDTFRDVTGELNFRIERFKRSTEEAEWVIDSIWSARVNQTRIIKEENGTSFVKMALPEEERKSWNGNAFNTLGDDFYSIINFKDTFATGNFEFFPTLEVEQANFSSAVNRDVRREVYAEGIGLVYLFNQRLQFINDPNDPNFGLDSITDGFFFEYQYVDHQLGE